MPRKFVEAQKVQPTGKTGKADGVLNQIRKLYAVEKQAKWRKSAPITR